MSYNSRIMSTQEMLSELQKDTQESKVETSGGIKLPSAVGTIAWSSMVAALAGLAAFLGRAMTLGENAALGLYALASPPIDQRDIIGGAILILGLAVEMLLFAITVRLIYLGTAPLMSEVKWLRPPKVIRNNWRWLALAIASIDALFIGNRMVDLVKSCEGLLFKPLPEIDRTWTRFLLEPNRETYMGYVMLYSALLTVFIVASGWFVTDKSQNMARRIVVAFIGIGFIVSTMFMYAYIEGAAATASRQYPIVDFSGMRNMFPSGSTIPILLGHDDKMFAILVVRPSAQPNKILIYLPRAEVKYLAELRTAPLWVIDKADELKKIGEQMELSNPQ